MKQKTKNKNKIENLEQEFTRKNDHVKEENNKEEYKNKRKEIHKEERQEWKDKSM